MSDNRKSKSPYQRYSKAPYRYSELYERWHQAAREGRWNEACRLGQLHTARFLGMPAEAEEAA